MTREEVKAYIIQHCNPYYPHGNTKWETAMNMAIEALQQPEIVRCRDCKHWGKHGLCDKWDYYISNDDFYCGCAKRREG